MDNFSKIFNETYNLFKTQSVSVIGEGYKDIATNPVLFESYVDSLLAGAGSDARAEMEQLIRNSNSELLSESTISGIAPIASMQGPVIRKLWPMFALKNAVVRAVAKSPSLLISYTKPYFTTVGADGEEVRHYVPSSYFNSSIDASDLAGNYEVHSVSKTEAAAGATTILSDVHTFSTHMNKTASLIKRQPLDADFALVSVAYKTATTYTTDTVVNVNKKIGVENVIVYDFNVSAGEGADTMSGTVLVRVDLQKGIAQTQILKTTAAGKFAEEAVTWTVKLRAHYSTEYNENVTSWNLELAREDLRIGTGEHMVAPVTVETIKDMKALYQLDATKELIDLMANAFAMNVDTKILKFLKESFLSQPGIGEFRDYAGAADFLAVFDVKPAPNFTAGPKAWREELKPVIDHLAGRIKNQTHLRQGIFVIAGNPLDVQLITNIDWKFRGGQQEVDGVAVDYSLGAYYAGAYTYRVISTEIIPQGGLYVVFLPAKDDQITYKYWAYTFSTEMGYRDPQHSMVPAVMMTKRDLLKSFLPAIAMVKIVGNDAGAAYDPFRDYIPTASVSDASGYEESDFTAQGGATVTNAALAGLKK